jgi:hypothetical protein
MAKAKKAAVAPKSNTETFTVHNVTRDVNENGNRVWVKAPAGSFTADLSTLTADKAEAVRKALGDL